ncbi:MAG TPA: hypothetical protein VF469_17700, partial [Kofleriaceae bacterium]
MPIRSLLVLLVAATACVSNPDVRPRTIEGVVRDGRGGWIVVTQRNGAQIDGELIAVDPGDVRVLTATGLVLVAKPAVATARLWAWQTEHGVLGLWGTAGMLSTITHGFWLVFSAPIWFLSTTITTSVESRASIVDYPDDGWGKLSPWARFPQGLPAGVTARDLFHQDRASPPDAGPTSAP